MSCLVGLWYCDAERDLGVCFTSLIALPVITGGRSSPDFQMMLFTPPGLPETCSAKAKAPLVSGANEF